jgi:DNA mismatch repair ATPase MutL
MRLAQMVSTSALSLLFTTTALVYAQDQREEPKPAQESRPEATKPRGEPKSPRQDEAKPDKPGENRQRQGEDKTTRDERKQEKKNAKQEDMKSGPQADRAAQSGQHAQRAADRRSAHIPDVKFRAQFGRQHRFAIQRTTVEGQPGFQYGGYSFVIVDTWPADWAYTDDCYIDYVDGEYFLFDLLHPGIQVALVVVM